MNVEGIPWAHDAEGFAIVLGLCVVLIAAGWLVPRVDVPRNEIAGAALSELAVFRICISSGWHEQTNLE